MKKILIPIFLFASLTACDKKADNQKVMIDEVMAIHDEVMPKMDEIMSLKSSLDSVSKVSPDSVKARELSSALEVADTKMMDWMEEYNPDLLAHQYFWHRCNLHQHQNTTSHLIDSVIPVPRPYVLIFRLAQ